MQPSRHTRRGLLLAGAAALGASAMYETMDADAARAGKRDTIQTVLDTALAAERVATTFYYTMLTTPAVVGDQRLAGRSADPNNPGLPPGGDPGNVRNMQAALDAEAKHAAALIGAGASAATGHYYFPATTFDALGDSMSPGMCLGVLEALETLQVGLYVTAADTFLRLRRPDLAGVIAQILGVEAEHRLLGRAIAGVDPINNLTLQRAPYSSIDAAASALRPYLTGHGFAGPAGPPLPLPSATQVARVVGKYGTHIVKQFV